MKNIQRDDINYVHLFRTIYSKGILWYHTRYFYDREKAWQGKIGSRNKRDFLIHPLQILIFSLWYLDKSRLLGDEREGIFHSVLIVHFSRRRSLGRTSIYINKGYYDRKEGMNCNTMRHSCFNRSEADGLFWIWLVINELAKIVDPFLNVRCTFRVSFIYYAFFWCVII